MTTPTPSTLPVRAIGRAPVPRRAVVNPIEKRYSLAVHDGRVIIHCDECASKRQPDHSAVQATDGPLALVLALSWIRYHELIAHFFDLPLRVVQMDAERYEPDARPCPAFRPDTGSCVGKRDHLPRRHVSITGAEWEDGDPPPPPPAGGWFGGAELPGPADPYREHLLAAAAMLRPDLSRAEALETIRRADPRDELRIDAPQGMEPVDFERGRWLNPPDPRIPADRSEGRRSEYDRIGMAVNGEPPGPLRATGFVAAIAEHVPASHYPPAEDVVDEHQADATAARLAEGVDR